MADGGWRMVTAVTKPRGFSCDHIPSKPIHPAKLRYMSPEQRVQVNDLAAVRDAARQYVTDNNMGGYRAEDRDFVWSYRYIAAKLSLMHQKEMTFGELTQAVQTTLNETSSPITKELTASLIAEKICTPVGDIILELVENNPIQPVENEPEIPAETPSD